MDWIYLRNYIVMRKFSLFSRYKREEARINAWENLQKAKAEAELKKLEVGVSFSVFVELLMEVFQSLTPLKIYIFVVV